MKKRVIECIRDYILTCPYLNNLSSLGINFLDKDSNSFSIEEVPEKRKVEMHVDGSSERQVTFIVASIFDFSEELETQITNTGFFEDFSEWIEENNDNEIFPKLREGETPTSIEVVTDAYLYGLFDGLRKARYQIQCKLIYEKEGKIK